MKTFKNWVVVESTNSDVLKQLFPASVIVAEAPDNKFNVFVRPDRDGDVSFKTAEKQITELLKQYQEKIGDDTGIASRMINYFGFSEYSTIAIAKRSFANGKAIDKFIADLKAKIQILERNKKGVKS